MTLSTITLESTKDFLAKNLPSDIKLESLKAGELLNGLAWLGFTLWKKDQDNLDCAYLSVRCYPKDKNYTVEFTSSSLPDWKRCTTTNFYKWVNRQMKLI